MVKKNLLKIVNLLVLLASLIIFILAETKSVELYYPWHMAICYALGVIGLVSIVKSIFDKKLTSFGLGFLLVIGFIVYLFFAVLHLDALLGICLVLAACILLYIVKYLFNIRSDFAGDNKKYGYKHYTERRKEEKEKDNNN